MRRGQKGWGGDRCARISRSGKSLLVNYFARLSVGRSVRMSARAIGSIAYDRELKMQRERTVLS
ncbi:hypothetical protein CKA32_006107 [Geitlerinema sp. FC II]|nr:hypothetical protein CKA32_006107 [Geitlerinema sp. FC II]